MSEFSEVPGMEFLDTKTDISGIPFEKTAIFLTEQGEKFAPRLEQLKERAMQFGTGMSEVVANAGRAVNESPVGDFSRWVHDKNAPIADFFNEHAVDLTLGLVNRTKSVVEWAQGLMQRPDAGDGNQADATLGQRPEPGGFNKWAGDVAQKLEPAAEFVTTPIMKPLAQLAEWYKGRQQVINAGSK